MKTLLVIGASSEVGSALIARVAERYEVIWAHYRQWNDHLEALKGQFGDKIRFLQADLSSVPDTERMISDIKSADLVPDHIVHLTADKVFMQKFTKTKWESFDRAWTLSARSAVLLLQAFLPKMQKRKSGKILFMLSSATMDTPPRCQAAYVTVKYAMLGLVKSLAAEYVDKGITVNGVSPDMIQTKFISEFPDLMVEQYASTRPRKRLLSVEEVVPTFAFLLSEEADGITGENIGIRA